jgi:hypothetical protein
MITNHTLCGAMHDVMIDNELVSWQVAMVDSG